MRAPPRSVDSVVCASAIVCGGTKSLYAVCGWLSAVGRSTIGTPRGQALATWFHHGCRAYDYSYVPQVLLYPEVFQPHHQAVRYHVCLALGQTAPIAPHADLTVCKSPEVRDWVAAHCPQMPTIIIPPGIERAPFEYDGRPKREIISFMPRRNKHPETLSLLRRQYGDRVVEISGRSEREVAEILKESKVFVWRGAVKEGSPRPPKEAMVAGCVVVGLQHELNERYLVDFGIRCSDVDELIVRAGEALTMPVPSPEERAVVRDSAEEMLDWITLMERFSR